MNKQLYREPKNKTIVDEIEEVCTRLVKIFSGPKVLICDNLYVSEMKVLKLNKCLARISSKQTVDDEDILTLYYAIPDELVLAIKENIVGLSGTMTYEEMLKHFMNIACNVDTPLSRSMEIAKIDKYFGERMVYNSVCSINSGTLAVIWSALILSIYGKYVSEVDSYNLSKAIKCGIAFSMGVGVLLLQYEHKSSGSPTNYLRKLSNIYYKFRSRQASLPDILNMDRMKMSISEASSYDKMRMGQLFNMVYTFRIGDACLSKLTRGSSYLDITSIIRSAWPLPTDSDVTKMYRLYTENRIYNI